MFFISHRGNLNGPDPENENSIEYIKKALDKNFDVEIDLWFRDSKFYLGHDFPKEHVKIEFLMNKKFWIHAKNLECFYELNNHDMNYFWHEEDKIIITSKGYFWNYPGTRLSSKSICVLPEKNNIKKTSCLGYCSDYIMEYYDRYNNI